MNGIKENERMNLIITMAGRSMRFKDDGYKIPKYLLPWGDTPVLNKILTELTRSKSFDNVYLIANKKDIEFMPHVHKIMRTRKIPIENLFLIHSTKSQAGDASVGIKKKIKRFEILEGSICFHNIDTILYNRNFEKVKGMLLSYDGYIDTFVSNNHSYSYVVEHKGTLVNIAEKIVISDTATSGLYGFSSAYMYLKHYDGQQYISEVYQKMLKNGCEIRIGDRHTETVTIVLGTPEAYNSASYLLDLDM